MGKQELAPPIVDFLGYDEVEQTILYRLRNDTINAEPLTVEFLDRPMTDEARQTLAQILKLDDFRISGHVIPEDRFKALMAEFGY